MDKFKSSASALIVLLIILMFLGACQGDQSIFEGAGKEASQVLFLWWSLLAISTFVFLLVCFFLLFPFFKKINVSDAKLTRGFYVGIFLTIILLFAIVFMTFRFSHFIDLKNKENWQIKIVGKRWWWEVIYFDKNGKELFKTANEIHIPKGRPIKFKLVTDNVIHSFWVPALGGKVDMIPGQANYLSLESNEEGIFRGQCAEFCGLQHAFMAFEVIVESQKNYSAWISAQSKAQGPPEGKLNRYGAKVFQKLQCANCHTIRGLYEDSEAGPDLTHLMSRRQLASATIPNTKGHLGGWISDPDGIKPGSLMPGSRMGGRDFKALLYFLESLK